MAGFKRTKLIVNRELQGTLVLRAVVYWLACIATMELLSLAWQIVAGPEQPTFAAYFTSYEWRAAGGRLLIASLLLVPIIWDLLVFSNRFAGPLFRMQRILRTVAKDGTVEHVQLRSKDYLQTFAKDLNSALQFLVSKPGTSKTTAAAQAKPTNGLHEDDESDSEDLVGNFSAAR